MMVAKSLTWNQRAPQSAQMVTSIIFSDFSQVRCLMNSSGCPGNQLYLKPHIQVPLSSVYQVCTKTFYSTETTKFSTDQNFWKIVALLKVGQSSTQSKIHCWVKIDLDIQVRVFSVQDLHESFLLFDRNSDSFDRLELRILFGVAERRPVKRSILKLFLGKTALRLKASFPI